MTSKRFAVAGAVLLGVLGVGLARGLAPQDKDDLPTGQRATPLAPRGAKFEALNPHLANYPNYTAGQAVTTVVSPDHKTMLALTSGYNLVDFTSGPQAGKKDPAASNEYVFVYDIGAGAPVQRQTLQVPNTYSGIAFAPSGNEFYVSGGDNDNVHFFALEGGLWKEAGEALKLGHAAGLGIGTKPEAAGIAVTPAGSTLVVADYGNDAISVLGRKDGQWTKTNELDLRPGQNDPKMRGVAGGEFPYWVTIKGNDTAYVSSIRDREIVEVRLGDVPKIVARIKVPGEPNRMVLNRAETRLYVAEDNSDSVGVIDTTASKLLGEIKVGVPPAAQAEVKGFKGANTNSLTLSPDEKTLYVTNGGENAVAVVRLDEPVAKSKLAGMIPSGWYPNSVSVSGDGRMLYVVNGESAAGPNPMHRKGVPNTANQYSLQLDKGGLQSYPLPNEGELAGLTSQVIANNHFERRLTAEQIAVMTGLQHNIHHALYVIKENRTYDQVLGDLEVGNGDPKLTEFPAANTPNFHALAKNFVTLDSFYCSGWVSGDGWPWSTSAEANDVIEKEIPVNYAQRGLKDDAEGTNRDVNVGIATNAARKQANAQQPDDDDLMPGNADVTAPDADDGEAGAGYIWNAALRKHLTLRNYGFFLDLARYGGDRPDLISEEPDPAAKKLKVAYSTSAVLAPYTDPYFRGFDQNFPDYYRFKEWEREFDQYVAQGKLPNLELLRIEHDHFGSFRTALAGLNTPELQMADDDYAIGLIADKIAHSPFKDDTLIFVVEDDAQDGEDHVDAHRSPAFIIGPYVKHNAVISTPYNTVSLVRTMEDILGIGHLNLHDNSALPMTDVFDLNQKTWSYTATPSRLLANSQLPIPGLAHSDAMLSTRHGAYWAEQTEGMDFSQEDKVDNVKFNLILWEGLMPGRAYPTERSGEDLRADRERLLKDANREP